VPSLTGLFVLETFPCGFVIYNSPSTVIYEVKHRDRTDRMQAYCISYKTRLRFCSGVISTDTKGMGGLRNEKSFNFSTSSDASLQWLLMSRVWHHSDAARVLLRLNLLCTPADTSHHTPHSALELTVFGGIYERVDTAAEEQWQRFQVVEPVNSKYFLIWVSATALMT